MKKLLQSQKVKATSATLLSSPRTEKWLLRIFIFLLPVQLGFHFWPDWSLLFGVRIDYLSPTIFFTDLLALILIILNFKKIYSKINKTNHLLLVAYFLFISLNTIFAKNWQVSAIKWLKMFELMLLSIYFIQKVKTKDILKPLLYSIVFFSVLGILQFINQSTIGGIFYYLGERNFNSYTPGIAKATYLSNFSNILINNRFLMRPYSTFSHPNSFAGFLVVGTFLTLSGKNLLTFIAPLVVFLTASKAAIASLFSFSFAKQWKTVLFTVLVLSLASLLFVQKIDKNIYSESIKKRIELIQSSAKIAPGNLLIGVGLNNFFNSTNSQQPVHNIFLLVLAETGIIGLALFTYLLAKALNNSSKNKKLKLTAALLVIIFTGSVDHYWLTLQQNQLLFAIVLGLSLNRKKESDTLIKC